MGSPLGLATHTDERYYMSRTIIIVDHDDDFLPDEAAEAVGSQVGVDDVTISSESLVMLAVGNPFEGLSVTGPFLDGDEAEQQAEQGPSDWWITDASIPQDTL